MHMDHGTVSWSAYLLARNSSKDKQNAMAKNPECPVCGDVLSDGRGLNGHLRMAHQITGEEHQEIMDEALAEAEEKQGVSSGDLDADSPLVKRIEEVALHYGITPPEVVRKIRRPMKKDHPWAGLDYEDRGFFSSGEKELVEQVLDDVEKRLEKEKEKVGDAMNEALQREIDRRR